MAEENKNKKLGKNIAGEAFEKGAEFGGAVAGTVGGAGIGAVGGAIVGSIVPGAGTLAGAKLGAKKGADTGAGIGKDAGKAIGKVGKTGINNYDKLSNPLELIVDKFIKLIVDFFIPIPIIGEYAGDLVAKYKGQIMMIIIGVVLTFTMLLFPQAGATANNYEGLPDNLKNYVEEGFTDSTTPQHSPFGGKGTEKTIITSYFDDPNYYAYYGRWHKALDIVPNYSYYQNNKAYKLYGDVIMFATCSGKATGKIDSEGANWIETVCKDGVHKTMHLHNKINFIPLGKTVDIVAGQPIAVMGETGMADGAHIHYGIYKNDISVDPLPYLNN